uniref:Glycoprotein n=1 Tax=Lepidopteran rhabdo-related virus OKIAV12 TaxID=2746297 RepID=A0A7D7IUD8_9RHAB|nr:glycoprotein [Lepidopteran rhabdo-related virus OKIAV12]
MMRVILYLITILTWLHAGVANPVINVTLDYPAIPSQTWISKNPINLSKVSCGINNLKTESHYIDLEIYLPYSNREKAGGHLCRRFNHKMLCNSGWAGFTYENEVSASPISKEQCVEAVSGYLNGKPPQGPLQFPKCETFSSKSADNFRIDVEYLIVDLDKRDVSYVHHLFPQGRCKDVYCKTVHPNMFWITENLSPPSCDDLRLGRASILLDEYQGFAYSLIDTAYIPPLPLQTGCKGISYCGHMGLRLDTGFLLLPATKQSITRLDNITMKMHKCNSSTTIKELSMFEMAKTRSFHEMLAFHQSQCERVIHRVQSHQGIKSSDLIYLGPILGGRGVTFRLRNNSLIQYETRWERVERFEIDCRSLNSCKVQFKKPGYSELFNLPTNSCSEPPAELLLEGVICMWFGGISFGTRGLYYPHRHFTTLIYEGYMDALEQGDEYIEPSAIPDNDEGITDDTDSEEGETSYESWWDTLKNEIWWIITGVVVLLGTLLLIRILLCISRSCSNGSPTSKGGSTIIELQTMGYLQAPDKVKNAGLHAPATLIGGRGVRPKKKNQPLHEFLNP